MSRRSYPGFGRGKGLIPRCDSVIGRGRDATPSGRGNGPIGGPKIEEIVSRPPPS